jgi:Lrp/AsnC family transcriptional regulator
MSRPINLTPADIRVLKLLQKDIGATRQDLAEAAGMSASTLWRRVSELEENGAIRARVALLDHEAVGVPVCAFLSVNLESHDKSTRKSFEALVEATPEIMECFSVTGAFDYMLIVRTKSVSEFEHILMDRILGHKSVASTSSQISLRQHKYSTELPL